MHVAVLQTHLIISRRSSTSSSLVGETSLLLATLTAVGLDVTLTASSSEVLLGFTGSVCSQEESVSTSGGLHNEFVESHALATSLGDSGTGGLGEAEGSNVNLGHVEESFIIGDGGDGDDGTVSLGTEVLDDFGEGKRGTIGSGGEESSEDGLSEGGFSSS